MSEILKRWWAGEGFPDTLVIDGHTHVGEWPHGANFDTVEETAEGAVAFMDANGVDAACVLSGGYLWNGTDYTTGNDILIEVARRVPGRIIPFAHINPNDRAETITAELERVYAAGCRCLKLLNRYQAYPGDGPNLMLLYQFAAEHEMLVINHYWEVDVLAHIAAKFPSVNFICAHYMEAQNELLKKYPNVYANIWNIGSLGWLERGIGEVGPHKFLFGSDAFMNPMSVGIGPVVYAAIPDGQKRMILGVTQARLLDRVGALPARLKQCYGL